MINTAYREVHCTIFS